MTKFNLKDGTTKFRALVLIGTISLTLAVHTKEILAMESPKTSVSDATVTCYATVRSLKSFSSLHDGALVKTTGFYDPGDGGEALYRIRKLRDQLQPNGADVIALKDGLVAVLLESKSVNYKMFGAIGDGENDDGVQIKLAHEYANKHRIPVVNLSGEFWIKQVNNIIIKINVH